MQSFAVLLRASICAACSVGLLSCDDRPQIDETKEALIKRGEHWFALPREYAMSNNRVDGDIRYWLAFCWPSKAPAPKTDCAGEIAIQIEFYAKRDLVGDLYPASVLKLDRERISPRVERVQTVEGGRPQTYYIAQASTDPHGPPLVLHFEKRSQGWSPGRMAFPWKDSLQVMVHVGGEKYAVDVPDIYREATSLLERVRTIRGS